MNDNSSKYLHGYRDENCHEKCQESRFDPLPLSFISISPYKKDRDYIRKRFENDDFLEVYVKCSVEECEKRDPKGQYRKARAGIIKNYTGISSPYEAPENPDLINRLKPPPLVVVQTIWFYLLIHIHRHNQEN